MGFLGRPGPKTSVERIASFIFVSSIIWLCAHFSTPRRKKAAQQATPDSGVPALLTTSLPAVNEKTVHRLLDDWADGIVAIGEAKLLGGDYVGEASAFVDRLYAYGIYPVLFKPSRAAVRPFRHTREGALSYFVGGNPGYPEDSGFAINPWRSIRMETTSISTQEHGAVAMGIYYFTDMAKREFKAEFTIGMRYDDMGRLRIIVHHSSLPYGDDAPTAPDARNVTEAEVKAVLKAWGDSIVEIGKVKSTGRDYVARAAQAIDELYAYDVYPVQFKATRAADEDFRPTRAGALSYFVGGNKKFPKDKGFAIHPWTRVRFETTRISLHDSDAVAMGVYFFRDLDGKDTKAEFTFGFRHDREGNLKIVLQHSALPYEHKPSGSAANAVTEQHVRMALKEWGDGIVAIGKAYRAHGKYRHKAAQFVDNLYAYGILPVLFKPTKAADHPFRATREGVLSYLVGGNKDFPEDSGFAITPWTQVVFRVAEISTHENSAVAMGSYEFTDTLGNVAEAEFTFGYHFDNKGKLRIVLHHSSLPYQAPEQEPAEQQVTQEEVVHALQEWGDRIVEIGSVKAKGGNYRKKAVEMVDSMYAYDIYPVMFKPALAVSNPFRPTREGAISYFVGGDRDFPDDVGFAINPGWKAVIFRTEEIQLHESSAIAMGTYKFAGHDGEEVTKEVTMGFRHDHQGHLRIVLHHSSMPYSG